MTDGRVDVGGVSAERLVCGTYDVVVGRGLLSGLAADLISTAPATKYVLITDTNVAPLYGEALLTSLTRACAESSLPPPLYRAIAPGEPTKNRATKATLEDWMLRGGCDRKTVVIALGGGVVGDLVGFVAATYMRGVRVVQVPTSLLAMVDSSIGGKTAIDTNAGKNLVGAFHRPVRVYIDPDTLKTLPKRELCNGMAEIIKAGAIRSAALFARLEQESEAILARDLDVLCEVIRDSARIKVDVVVEDEKEAGLRALLNFGHSIGHGIEALLTPTWLHGECVAVGMIKEIELARGRGILAPDALNRMLACLQAYNLPVKMPAGLRAEDVLEKMGVDKKNHGGVKRIVLLRSLGDAGNNAEGVDDAHILRVMAPGAEVVPHGAVEGAVRVPGSKSISNRVLLMAALGKGPCRVTGLLHSDDTKVMMQALTQLGVEPFVFADGGHTVVVQGSGGAMRASTDRPCYLSNAGTASRFLTTAVTLARGGSSIVTGNHRMQERPIRDLVDALRGNGVSIEYQGTEGCPPLLIKGDGFPGGRIQLSAGISSQYVSSILISAPYATKPVELELVGEVVSQPYIDMTVKLMAKFGVEVTRDAATGIYYIPNTGGGYVNPPEFEVEADASSASYPLAMAAISGGRVTVQGVGSDSLQGDADFCLVLEKLGAKVERTGNSTTVTGPPPTALRETEVDMASTTDCFMTACAVMASAPKGQVHRITNIANQRVKECDRIAAMVTELGKCGVTCRELPTGIEIEAAGPNAPSVLVDGPGADIHCYKDHRIAMSFGVLGCRWPGVHVTDQACTDKTYPGFWDDLCLVLGGAVKPWLDNKGVSTTAAAATKNNKSPSLFVIGMRGSGKSTLGAAAAAALGYTFIDADTLVDARSPGGSIKQLVAEQGWPAFRALESEVLNELLRTRRTGCIVACGGGVVEAEANRAALSASGLPVAWLRRDLSEIEAYLADEAARPAYGESVRDVYARREPWFAACATRECLLPAGTSKATAEDAFTRFAEVVTRGVACSSAREGTFFLSLTFPDLGTVPPSTLKAAADGAHAVELRVDLLAHHTSADVVAHQVALLRARCSLPIIFTVRSQAEGGGFTGDESAYFNLCRLALRLGVAWVDVEACWSEAARRAFVAEASCANVRTLGSAHFASACSGVEALAADYRRAWLKGAGCDVVKLVYTAHAPSDALALQAARAQLPVDLNAPLIALAMGATGRVSRVLNTIMSPVTHPALPAAAAPGQLSVAEVLRARKDLGLTAPRRYLIFGHPVRQSPSPLMHNTNFVAHGLPFIYGALDSPDIEAVAEAMRAPDYHGGSVTMPHKQAIIPLLQELAPAAAAIGAVNTVVRTGSNTLRGENTDWIGIREPLAAALGSRPRKRALVVGAGGTARAALYALARMRFAKVYIWNRTYERAAVLAKEFGCVALQGADCATALSSVVDGGDSGDDSAGGFDAIVCTLPPTAAFVLPDEARLFVSRPAVLDVAYLPAVTPLLSQARAAGCPTATGFQMLMAQGVAAQRIWTLREPRADVMATVTQSSYQRVAVSVAHGGKGIAMPHDPPTDLVTEICGLQISTV